MASSRICDSSMCKRCARGLCYCCQQNLCLDHFKEHSDLLNAQMTPLADQISELFDQVNSASNLFQFTFLVELNKWRAEACNIIEKFCETKKQQFEEFVHKERNEHKTEVNRLRNQINELTRNQEVTQEHIDSINDGILSLRQKIKYFQHPQFTLSPLIIDYQLVDFHPRTSQPHDVLPLSPPYRTIRGPPVKFPPHQSWVNPPSEYSIAASNNHVLVGGSKLTLLDRQLVAQRKMTQDSNYKYMFWSRVLGQFIIINGNTIFTLDEKTMIVEKCSTIRLTNGSWNCGACSNNSLFLLTQPSILPFVYEYTLRPSIQLVKKYELPVFRKYGGLICDMASNTKALALLIYDRLEEDPDEYELRLILYSSTTLKQYCSIRIEGLYSNVHSMDRKHQCCALTNDQWMVIDPEKHELLHFSADGNLVKMQVYDQQPWRAVQLGNDMLAVLTKEGVNVHKLF